MPEDKDNDKGTIEFLEENKKKWHSSAEDNGVSAAATMIPDEELEPICIAERYSNFLNARVSFGEMEESLKKLSEGTILWKIRGVTKHYRRHYSLDLENYSLIGESKKWWSPGSLKGGDSSENEVSLVDITEIREGWKTDVFHKLETYLEKNQEKRADNDLVFEEDRCFSIIYGPGGRQTLDFLCSSAEEKALWVSGLCHLTEKVKSLHKDRQYDLWLKTKFESADKDNNKSLSLSEVTDLLQDLNIKMEKRHSKKLFNEANTNKRTRNGEQVLDAQEFMKFYKALLKMPGIEKVFNRYADEKSHLMNVDQLMSFFKNEQKCELSVSEAENIIKEFEFSGLNDCNLMAFEGFYNLLLSRRFDAFDSSHQTQVHQDMTKPLSHYYISSSHNTYLTGHQLAGESSVEGYISALKKGCRVVELDIWDGEDGEPIIYHGHTLTSKITLADVLRDGIKRYAFLASPYPVILSIENHLSLEQQKIMVQQLKDILGGELLTDSSLSDVHDLPSPEQLKNKIIVKAKKPQGPEVESDDEDDQDDAIEYIDSVDSAKKKSHKPLAPELRDIVNVCEGKKFVSFEESFKSDNCVHFPSLRENKAQSLLESNAAEFVKFTQKQIAKIYPIGTRTDSSNLKPYLFWSVGAQVVTLNMQTEDKANFYNEAHFRSNGNCGYVLKPDILLTGSYDPANLADKYAKTLIVTVISGQHLPPSAKPGDIIDPYVQVKTRGHPQDCLKQRTTIVKNNGFNPVWNEKLELKLKVAPLALVYFTVRDESSMARDPVLALACIPFHSLGTGYRHVHLTDITGKGIAPAALFVNIDII